MSSDILERLREPSEVTTDWRHVALHYDAAEEITRLRADRRERIATAFMAALLPQKGWEYFTPNHAAKYALRYADALIEEIDKEAKP